MSQPAELTTMTDDERDIDTLIRRWVAAIAAGELENVLVHHADDIVMFDVPPPDQGVRGLDAYRATWSPFFEWLRAGSRFEIETLRVIAGIDVAFAWALLLCGTKADFQNPDLRLRLTVCLRKLDGQWVVTHEHHSFPDTT